MPECHYIEAQDIEAASEYEETDALKLVINIDQYNKLKRGTYYGLSDEWSNNNYLQYAISLIFKGWDCYFHYGPDDDSIYKSNIYKRKLHVGTKFDAYRMDEVMTTYKINIMEKYQYHWMEAELVEDPHCKINMLIRKDKNNELIAGRYCGISSEKRKKEINNFPIILDYNQEINCFRYGDLYPGHERHYISDIHESPLYTGTKFTFNDGETIYNYKITRLKA